MRNKTALVLLLLVGIVITGLVTSWDNTDHAKAHIVHVLHDDGSRFALSRTPILYCKGTCEYHIVNHIGVLYEKEVMENRLE